MKRRELVKGAERLHHEMSLQPTTCLPRLAGHFSEWPEPVPSQLQKFPYEDFPGWPDALA
jgi:hypothetical protein